MLSPEESYIFDLAQNPQYAGELEAEGLHFEGANLSCGDEVTLHLQVTDNVITSAKHTSRACAVCIAGTEILIENIIGKKVNDVQTIKSDDILKKFPIALSPIRQKCATLALQTLKNGLNQPKTDSN